MRLHILNLQMILVYTREGLLTDLERVLAEKEKERLAKEQRESEDRERESFHEDRLERRIQADPSGGE